MEEDSDLQEGEDEGRVVPRMGKGLQAEYLSEDPKLGLSPLKTTSLRTLGYLPWLKTFGRNEESASRSQGQAY